jgi:tripartite-type tricarboxylate transporter receptor subunit TctC
MAIPSALALIKAGKVRALGVTSAARSSILPDVPTIAEQGYQGFKISVWYGLLVPTGVPAPIINRLNRDVNTVLEMPSVREVIQSQGAETDIGSPAAFAAMIQSEYVKLRDIVRASGLNPE